MLPVYVDMDDVICRTTESFLKLLEREFAVTRRLEEVFSFDLQKSFGLSSGEYHRFFDLAHRREEVLAFEPVPDAVETLRMWSRNGCRIIIVTGRLTVAYEASLEWLERHHIPYDDFLMVDKYRREEMDPEIAITLDTLAGMSFRFAVEDSAHMCRFLSEKMGIPVFLHNRPWNHSLPTDSRIRRFTRWPEIADAFTPIA